jgi:predicted ATP-grasp superfamily ATP-dependent carboligase
MVPYESRMRKECLKIAEVIGEEFGLSGSYGIDFVLSEKPYVIEVNPRFQDTLECIERVYDTNVVDLHMKACSGMLPEKNLTPKRACSKGILYARKKLVVGGDLTKVSCCVDVYRPGTVVKKDEPVCSAFGCGKTSEESFLSLKNKISEVQGFLKEV